MKLKGGKVKLSLDLTKIQGFFVNHVEKLVLAVLALVSIAFVYSAATTDRYTKTPDQLSADAASAADSYEKSTWDRQREQIVVPDYAAEANKAAVARPVDEYRPRQNWTARLFPHEQRRRAPAYLPIEELRAVGEFGAFQPTGGVEKPLGRSWAVVTGAIPYAKQRSEYVLALGGVDAGGALDPKYNAVALFREEVVGEPSEAEKLNGKRIAVKEVEEVLNQSGPGEEIIDPKFIITLEGKNATVNELCNALPALLGNRKWGSSVGHPKIPLPAPSAVEENPEQPDAAAEAGKEPTDEQPGKPPAGDTNEPFGNEELKPDLKPEAAAPAATATVVEDNGYRLFRFFDFTVEPGKRYRYQVVLQMLNPNYNVDTKLLESPELGKSAFARTEFSNISEPVSIPRGAELLAGSAKPARSTTEAVARVLLRQFSNKGGAEATHEVELLKGQVANFPASPAFLHRQGGKPEEATDEDFTTDTMLVDVSGGERISVFGKADTKPAEVLLLDPDGRLVVRSEMEDLATYQSFMPSETDVNSTAPTQKPTNEAPSDPLNNPSSRTKKSSAAGR